MEEGIAGGRSEATLANCGLVNVAGRPAWTREMWLNPTTGIKLQGFEVQGSWLLTFGR